MYAVCNILQQYAIDGRKDLWYRFLNASLNNMTSFNGHFP